LAGNLPPYNTYSGERDGPIDPNAPHMDNPVGLTQKLFVCGDPRANENPVLLSMHILFVREHNRLCEELAQQHPDWNDEQLYQHARKLVSGLIQSVHYDEWLPTVGVNLPPYQGYNPNVH
ncbi:peroxidase family protein, partial [Arthrospira platensis SPKY1]|nr:peroxidase family protein [Arthrospira platensis SPKY1]